MSSDQSLLIFALLSFLSFAIEALFAAGVGALGRITRAEAGEAFADSEGAGADRVLGIVARRNASLLALSWLRIFFTALGSMFIMMALFAAFDDWWTIVGSFVAAFLVIQIFFGIFSPAKIGQQKPVAVLRLIALPVGVISRIIYRQIQDTEDTEESEQLREDQLAVMVERVADSQVLDENDRELLQSVFDLNHTLAREVMVPRTDMVTIQEGESLPKVMSLFNRSGFSRVPVIGEEIDDVVGVVYLKDALRRFLRGDAADVKIRDIMREPVFVPETKVVDELMREMQANQVHIALVVDEYGGIAGIVTIEDIVEELVGEIDDEHDRTAPEIVEIEEGTYRVPARLPMSDLGDLFGIKLEDDDVDTVGGLFAKLIGRVPIAGATTSVAGIVMEADRFGGRRKRMLSVIARRDESEMDNE